MLILGPHPLVNACEKTIPVQHRFDGVSRGVIQRKTPASDLLRSLAGVFDDGYPAYRLAAAVSLTDAKPSRLISENHFQGHAVFDDVLEFGQRKLVRDTGFEMTVGLVLGSDIVGDQVVAFHIGRIQI